jgi:hypothetical protein
LGAAYHLSLPPEKCALVAAHIEDLKAAERCGFRTVYVRRRTEDEGVRDGVTSRRRRAQPGNAGRAGARVGRNHGLAEGEGDPALVAEIGDGRNSRRGGEYGGGLATRTGRSERKRVDQIPARKTMGALGNETQIGYPERDKEGDKDGDKMDKDGEADVVVDGFVELAELLGCC